MKMKKFLIIYLIFAFSLFISCLAAKTKEANAQEQINKTQRGKLFIFTDKFEPTGRVICQTFNETMVYDWKSAKDAVLELKEEEERFRKCGRDYKFYVQYADGRVFNFLVKQSIVFSPLSNDARLTAIEKTPGSSLVLISCWPIGTNYKRIAIQAELI